MALTTEKTVVVPLKGANYLTWKVQVKMALMKDDLWGFVDGTEIAPSGEGAEAKFKARKNKALAVIVLAMDPSLLYLIGDHKEPKDVWMKLENHFQKKTWANKLELRRKLSACRLKEGKSVEGHVKEMIEIFEGLAVIGSAVDEEDKVIYLLASLPKTFNMLVTALEAHEKVPGWETVIEKLLNEERKAKEGTYGFHKRKV